ncbi:MAG: nitroreductase [Candidatus Azotimanducaceae bacterium]|jgi:nitroreductase
METSEIDLDFFDLASNMRAMRRLKSDPVSMDLIWKVLNAGVQAPSGQNTQPWKFVLVSQYERKHWFAERYAEAMETRFGLPRDASKRGEKASRGQLRAIYHQMDHLQDVPYLLMVCGERDWPFKVAEEDRIGLAPPNFGAVYPCVQNILLACRAVGLGAALTTMHQVFEDELHEYFNIPDSFGVVVTIPIGYPLGKFGPVSRISAQEKTFINRWEN